MVAIIVSAAVTCAGALLLGQAVLRACGAKRWSWLAAPVGLSVEILVAVPAIHVPGRSITTAVVLGALIVAAGVWILRDPAMRPPPGGLVAAAPTAVLTMIPFAAAGRAGPLGVGVNNDMANHMMFAESYRSLAAFRVEGLLTDYPFGPHALVATLAQGLGIGVDMAFAGLSVALPLLLAWAALGTLRRASLPARVAVATLAGGGYLVAAYYGQGAFKEVALALLVVGVVVALLESDLVAGDLRWVPIAFLVAGVLSVYSLFGLAWPGSILVAAFAVAAVRRLRGGSARRALGDLRAELVPIGLAAMVLLVVIVPQLPRLSSFAARSTTATGTGIEKEALGNLAQRIPLSEAFGVWDSADFRFGPLDPGTLGIWVAFVAVLVAVGVVLALRRGEWALVLAAVVSFAVWAASDRTQSPYVAAKALVVLTPLLLLLAVRPLVDGRGVLGATPPRWWTIVASLLAVVLVVKAMDVSVQALRASPVGPTDRARELQSLRPTLDGGRAIFLGNDDFLHWELAGVRVRSPYLGFQDLPLNPLKGSQFGMAFDIDTVLPADVNAARWVIKPRDPAASAMPPQLRLVKRTPSFELWQRTGIVAPRAILGEGDAGGGVFDCTTKVGRAIRRRGGVAALLPVSTGVAVPAVAPGTSVGVRLKLAPGTYDVASPYISSRPLSISVGPSLERVMPANLDRPGARYEIGRITVAPGTPFVQVGIYATKTRLTAPQAGMSPTSIVATPVGGRRVVPIRRACGKLVDWYRPGVARR